MISSVVLSVVMEPVTFGDGVGHVHSLVSCAAVATLAAPRARR